MCAGPRSSVVFPEKPRLVVSGVCQREQLLSACWLITGFKEKQFSFASSHFPFISRCSGLIRVHLLSQRQKKSSPRDEHHQSVHNCEDGSIFKLLLTSPAQYRSPVSPPLPPTLPPPPTCGPVLFFFFFGGGPSWMIWFLNFYPLYF